MKEVIAQARSRWYFYRNNFRASVNVLVGMIVVIFILFGVFLYLYQSRPLPDYYATSSLGGIFPLTPLADFEPDSTKNPLVDDYSK